MEFKSDMRSLIISVAYYSRRLAQVVYTLLVHIDSTKEIRGELCNCSHNNETVGSYQPFHDQVGHGQGSKLGKNSRSQLAPRYFFLGANIYI